MAKNVLHYPFQCPRFRQGRIGTVLTRRVLGQTGKPPILECPTATTGALTFDSRTGWCAIGDGGSEDGRYRRMRFDSRLDPAQGRNGKPSEASVRIILPCGPDP